MNQPLAVPSDMHVLEQITHLPLTLDGGLFQHYSAMKLGQPNAVAFYSRQLAAIAARVCGQSRHHDWVITAPPYRHLPAGANLLARKVHQLLALQDITTDLVEPRLHHQNDSFTSEAEFRRHYEYCKSSLEQRITSRSNQNILATADLAQRFRDKSLIIINDINVTGTQQNFMHKIYEKFQVKTCRWIYIFNVDKSLGSRHPELEHQINHSQIKSLDSFRQILADPGTDHTARCISRLFNEGLDNFHYLARSLTVEKRRQLHCLSVKEGRFNGKIFDPKMQILGSPTLPPHPVPENSAARA